MKKDLSEPIKKEDKNKKNIFKKFLEILNKKWLQTGITTIILILIIFLIYMGVTLLLDKYTLPEIDLTEQKIYSLSDETKTKMSNIDKEVKITLINYGDYETRVDIVKKYTTLNDLITMELIDNLQERTDLMQQYSLDADDTLIIISSNGKEKTLSEYDLYTIDYSTYEEIDLTEEALTNAIINITTEEKPVIYFMSNHAMYGTEYFYSVIEQLEKEANEVKTVDLLTQGTVPEDCDCLVITTLKDDITESERDQIINYINKGGELLLLCGPNLTDKRLDNFQMVLAEYGITLGSGVVFEGSSENMLSGYPDFIVEEVQSNSITNDLNMNLKVCLLDATNVIVDEDKMAELGVEYEELIVTTDEAFIRTDLGLNSATRTGSDSEEDYQVLAISATKTIDENTKSKIILYANELFATDMAINVNGYSYSIVNFYNNLDVVANSIADLNEREDIITIRKNYDSVTYTVTALQNYIIMAIIFAVPFLIILAGLMVWQVRRRKR